MYCNFTVTENLFNRITEMIERQEQQAVGKMRNEHFAAKMFVSRLIVN